MSEELEQLCSESWASSPTSAGRNAHFVRGIKDAVQAHRPWAKELQTQALASGLSTHLTKWGKREQVDVKAKSGKTYSRPRVVGARIKTDDGSQWTQIPLEGMTLDQINDKYDEYAKAIGTYRADMALMRKMRELCVKAGCDSVAAATAKLGVTVDQWLAA